MNPSKNFFSPFGMQKNEELYDQNLKTQRKTFECAVAAQLLFNLNMICGFKPPSANIQGNLHNLKVAFTFCILNAIVNETVIYSLFRKEGTQSLTQKFKSFNLKMINPDNIREIRKNDSEYSKEFLLDQLKEKGK